MKRGLCPLTKEPCIETNCEWFSTYCGCAIWGIHDALNGIAEGINGWTPMRVKVVKK